MEGYLGQIQAQAAAVETRLVVLERAAGEALAKARAEIADELYAAANPGETPEVAAAKKALADHIAETAAKEMALHEAIAKQEADAKAAAETGEPEPTKAAEMADVDETA